LENLLANNEIRGGVSTITVDDIMLVPLDELRKLDPQLYGNTKWADYVFLRFYFENGGNERAAAKDMGTSYTNFMTRLIKINNPVWRLFYRASEKAKKTKKKTQNAYHKRTNGWLFRVAFTTLGGDRARVMESLKISENTYYKWKAKLNL